MSQRALSQPRASWAAQARLRGGQARDIGLRLVSPVQKRAKKAPFVVVLLGLLTAGFMGLIFLSTLMQAQAFALADLQREVSLLEAQKEELSTSVDMLQSPAAIAKRAVAEGMVPNTSPVFLRLQDGRIIGKPVPAVAGTNVRKVD